MEKYTLITGASSGLGKELALLYAKDNNNLLLVATNETKLKKVIEEVKNTNNDIKVEYLLADLSKQEEREKEAENSRRNAITYEEYLRMKEKNVSD